MYAEDIGDEEEEEDNGGSETSDEEQRSNDSKERANGAPALPERNTRGFPLASLMDTLQLRDLLAVPIVAVTLDKRPT
jgi:hypothetical protein